MPAADHETFHWEETQGVVEELLDEGELTPDPERGVFVGEGLVLSPPRVQPVPPDCASAAAWLDALPLDLGLHLVILLQAGATSLPNQPFAATLPASCMAWIARNTTSCPGQPRGHRHRCSWPTASEVISARSAVCCGSSSRRPPSRRTTAELGSGGS